MGRSKILSLCCEISLVVGFAVHVRQSFRLLLTKLHLHELQHRYLLAAMPQRNQSLIASFYSLICKLQATIDFRFCVHVFCSNSSSFRRAHHRRGLGLGLSRITYIHVYCTRLKCMHVFWNIQSQRMNLRTAISIHVHVPTLAPTGPACNSAKPRVEISV